MKKMTYKLVMAVTCFGMMAGDAIAQERGEGAERRERASERVLSVVNVVRAPSVVNVRRNARLNGGWTAS